MLTPSLPHCISRTSCDLIVRIAFFWISITNYLYWLHITLIDIQSLHQTMTGLLQLFLVLILEFDSNYWIYRQNVGYQWDPAYLPHKGSRQSTTWLPQRRYNEQLRRQKDTPVSTETPWGVTNRPHTWTNYIEHVKTSTLTRMKKKLTWQHSQTAISS